MKHTIELATIARKIFKHQRHGLRDPHLIHPEREWLTGLLIALITLVLIGAWNIMSYLKYSDTSVTVAVVPDTDVVVYRESVVKAALATFAERKKIFDSLRTIPPIVPLPVVVEDTADLPNEPESDEDEGEEENHTATTIVDSLDTEETYASTTHEVE
jgi:hypothetical protein